MEITRRDGIPRDDTARLINQEGVAGVHDRLPVQERPQALRSRGEPEFGEPVEPLLVEVNGHLPSLAPPA
jgi:hypothetical protein